MPAGMPLGPPLKLNDPELYLSVFGGSRRPFDSEFASVPVIAREHLPAAAAAAVDRTIGEHLGHEPWPARRPPWFGIGWLEQAEAWIDDRLRRLDLARDGAIAPHRVWSLSAVLEVPLTGGTSVWFKAACEHFRAEPTITRAVGAFAAPAAPTVLALDADRAWMLLAALPPLPLNQAGRIQATASVMSELQMTSTAHLDALRVAGCPDRGLEPTLDAFGALLAERGSGRQILPWAEDRLGAFFGAGLPSSLVHGDLHPGNVAGGRQRVVFDWTDACISHPLLDAAHLLRRAGATERAAVRQIYVAGWGGAAEAAWDLAPLANQVFQAVTLDRLRRSLEPASQWEWADELERLLAGIHSVATRRD